MTIVKTIMTVIYIIICFALILVATMQSKDDGGLSNTITGSNSSNFLDKNKARTREGKEKKTTVILGVAFAILAVVVSILWIF